VLLSTSAPTRSEAGGSNEGSDPAAKGVATRDCSRADSVEQGQKAGGTQNSRSTGTSNGADYGIPSHP